MPSPTCLGLYELLWPGPTTHPSREQERPTDVAADSPDDSRNADTTPDGVGQAGGRCAPLLHRINRYFCRSSARSQEPHGANWDGLACPLRTLDEGPLRTLAVTPGQPNAQDGGPGRKKSTSSQALDAGSIPVARSSTVHAVGRLCSLRGFL